MNITTNEGSLDRGVRITLGVVTLLAAVFTGTWWLLIISIPALVTGLSGFCGIYALLGISTCPTTDKKTTRKKA